MVEKNNRRLRQAQKYQALRAKLRKKVSNVKLLEQERQEAGIQLQKLPKNSSYVRVRRRCNITGRPRGNLRTFGLSRLMFRRLAHQGKIPGVVKASW